MHRFCFISKRSDFERISKYQSLARQQVYERCALRNERRGGT